MGKTIDENKINQLKRNLEISFCVHRANLQAILQNEKLNKAVNHDKKLKIICALSLMFFNYYDAVTTLLQNKNYSSIYSVGRSSLECFSFLKRLCDAYIDDERFYNIYKYMSIEDVEQIITILGKETAANNKRVFLEKINSELKKIGVEEITTSNKITKQIKKKIKSIKDSIPDMEKSFTKRAENVLSELPEYNTDANGADCRTLYSELCMLSHNNISGIAERYIDADKEQPIFCDEHFTDNLIYPVLYMFVACGRHIELWLKDNVLTDKKNTENE